MYTLCGVDPHVVDVDVAQPAASGGGSGWGPPPAPATNSSIRFKVPEGLVQRFRKRLSEKYREMWNQQGIEWRLVETPAFIAGTYHRVLRMSRLLPPSCARKFIAAAGSDLLLSELSVCG